MLTREQILAANDLTRVKVAVPEWGGDVWLRVLTGAERDRWEAAAMKASERKDPGGLRTLLLTMSIVDESGAQVFGAKDVEALASRNAAVLERLAREAMAVSKLGEEPAASAEKN